MSPSITSSPTGPIVLVGQNNGITVIPASTPLARLNYFDGKFLRADDLNKEQRYLRSLVELSNQAGGHGVVHGNDVTEAGAGRLTIGPGLAIDPAGRVLLLPDALSVGVAELVEKSRGTGGVSGSGNGAGSAVGSAAFANCVAATADTPGTQPGPGDLFLVTLAHAEALCGEEDVYGRLCEEACVTSTDRPFRIEGIVIRARPLNLTQPLPTCAAESIGPLHLRSRVASCFFAGEALDVGSLISKAGLASEVWCRGSRMDLGTEVPIAVIGLSGGTLAFLIPGSPGESGSTTQPAGIGNGGCGCGPGTSSSPRCFSSNASCGTTSGAAMGEGLGVIPAVRRTRCWTRPPAISRRSRRSTGTRPRSLPGPAGPSASDWELI